MSFMALMFAPDASSGAAGYTEDDMGIIDRSLGYAPAQKAWKGGRKRSRPKNRVPIETKESIDRCLNCTRPAESCHGCMDSTSGDGKTGRPSKYDPAVLTEMLQMGCSQADIAAAFGVHPNTVGRWMRKAKEERK